MDWLSRAMLFIIIVVFIGSAECGRLNDYILDYQPLVYDRNAVHNNHQRVRRSVDSHLKIRFNAYGRDFHLKLQPATGVFGPNHMVHTDGLGPHHVDTSFIYHGEVQGEPESWVHLSVHGGRLEGQVTMPDTTYHIEPAAKYHKGQDPSLHTIIYPETHLDKDPYKHSRPEEASHCGVDHAAIREFMDRASRVKEEPEPKPNVHARASQSNSKEDRRGPHNIYSEYANRAKRSVEEEEASKSRQKRATLDNRNACPLHVRADPLFFNFTKYNKHGKTLSDSETEEDILAFFSGHVSAISRIYSNTVFETYDGNLQNTGLSFVIYRSTVMKDCNGRSNYYCQNGLDVSNYLDLTSEEDNDEYCLAFTFTYRDFNGGTLGLAWVAALDNPGSGVCGKHQVYSDGKKKSLNSGIVTIINFGRTVPNPVSQLTFAHEAGHNFGSPHDIGSAECAPFGTSRSDASNGNYIMFPSATSGDKPNNDEFSPCSRDNITRIISEAVDPGKRRANCFVVSGQAFCGNQITEDGEACDCGFAPCHPDTCCVGKTANQQNSGCKLVSDIDCSPDSGPCCKSDCRYVPSSDNKVCAEMSECKEKSKCNGTTFKCPEPDHKPDDTFCNDYSKICISGECIGPVCKKIAGGLWEECFQTSESTGDVDSLCFVACKNPQTNECISSKDTDALAKSENSAFKAMLDNALSLRSASSPAIQLPAGSACDNFRGYCDTFSKCQRIDSQGPFNQLTNMIFNPVNLQIVEDWIVEHWWAVILIALGVVVVMGVFIKVFGYNTPSQDPKQQRRRQPQGNQPRQPRQPRHPRHQGGFDRPMEMEYPPPYTVSNKYR